MQSTEEIDFETMVNGRKIYYSISEVCNQTGLEPHVLRYWESEFSQLRPKKNRAGNRAYRDKDIEIIRYIKHLLYGEKFTIPGAKKKLAETRLNEAELTGLDAARKSLNSPKAADMKQELQKILALLTG